MTSEHKVRANRSNAKVSTGPRTKGGKLRSARNALRHGLSVPISVDPTMAGMLDPLARQIAGADASSESLELARLVAAVQIDLLRIQQVRQQLLARAPKNFDSHSQEVSALSSSKDETLELSAEAIVDLAPRLIALDRYERRALSRRKFAIRKFYFLQKRL